MRNLHDGDPVPPVPTKKRGQKGGFRSPENQFRVVACRHGYVCQEDKDTLGWVILANHGRTCNVLLAKIEKLGGKTDQQGVSEAAGTIPIAWMEQLFRILRPVKKLKQKTANKGVTGGKKALKSADST
jgi:hypothetical protein